MIASFYICTIGKFLLHEGVFHIHIFIYTHITQERGNINQNLLTATSWAG